MRSRLDAVGRYRRRVLNIEYLQRKCEEVRAEWLQIKIDRELLWRLCVFKKEKQDDLDADEEQGDEDDVDIHLAPKDQTDRFGPVADFWFKERGLQWAYDALREKKQAAWERYEQLLEFLERRNRMMRVWAVEDDDNDDDDDNNDE